MMFAALSTACGQRPLHFVASVERGPVQRYPNDNIVRVLDGAGWHKRVTMPIPDNIRLLSLP